ncbi:hypothetical protein TRFO_05901 [Tritrichomonas foetus]|uniref:Uncharacterized protein n=1 Tax=Tritrichomonas foetus TaxID=1144522 RepID=A0A1J4K7E4_9EUKA|nr:hypothetical protein TRFO_05901 [Tritrichomonas foetus]|eukprot:OHT05333.1 hypothetical protein TRFO_05901 [Tritrichomonas foetus]
MEPIICMWKNELSQELRENTEKSVNSKSELSVGLYDLSQKFSIAWEDRNTSEILQTIQSIKQICDITNYHENHIINRKIDVLISHETFYPVILNILRQTLDINAPQAIAIEALSILDEISTKLIFDKENVKNFVISLYSFIKNRSIPQIIEYCLHILYIFSKRGGIYSAAVKDHLFFTDFLVFLAEYENKRSPVLLLTSFTSFNIDIVNMQRFIEVITNVEFDEYHRLKLLTWFFSVEPTSYKYVHPNIILPYISSNIQSENQKNQKIAMNCLSTLLKSSKVFFEFDYSIVFANVVSLNSKTSISALNCLSLVARIGKVEGVKILISFGIGSLIIQMLGENRPLQVQKSCAKCICYCILNCERDDIPLFLNTKLMEILINMLELDDLEFITILYKAFETLAGNPNGDLENQVSIFFYDTFQEFDGWDMVTEMMNKEETADIPLANLATKFYHNYNHDPIELPDF